MTRLIHKPLKVVCDTGGLPRAMYWQGGWQSLLITETWKDAGAWWRGAGEEEFFRVLTPDQGIYEIRHRFAGNSWELYRVYD